MEAGRQAETDGKLFQVRAQRRQHLERAENPGMGLRFFLYRGEVRSERHDSAVGDFRCAGWVCEHFADDGDAAAVRPIQPRGESVSNTFDLGGAWEGDTRDLSFKLGKTRATGGPSMRFNMAAKPRFTTTDAAGNAIGANGNVSSQWSFGNSVNMAFSPQLQET